MMRTYVLVVLLALVATAFTQDWQDLVRAGIGWAGAGLLYYVLWFVYPRGLGFGDVRLSGVLGIALGYVGTAELVVGVYAGFLLGGSRRSAADDAAGRAPQARAVRPVHAGRRGPGPAHRRLGWAVSPTVEDPRRRSGTCVKD